MPVLVFVVGIPTTVAIGTDLFQVIVTGSFGTFFYAVGNQVDPLMAIIILTAASAGSQIGATATRFVDPGRIRILYGVTVLSGCVAVALEQAASTWEGAGILGDIAAFVLLGVSGTMGLVIAVLLARALIRRAATGH